MKPIARMAIAVTLGLTTIGLATSAQAAMMKKKSPWTVNQTMDKVQAVLKKAGLTVFTRIDHAAGAKKAGMKLRPTQLILFGNPKAGTVLMNVNQSIGIALPMKMLVWKDAEGAVWLGYQQPGDLAKAYGIPADHKVIKGMTGALNKLSGAALKK